MLCSRAHDLSFRMRCGQTIGCGEDARAAWHGSFTPLLLLALIGASCMRAKPRPSNGQFSDPRSEVLKITPHLSPPSVQGPGGDAEAAPQLTLGPPLQ